MRHRIRQTHITDELQTGKAAGAAGGFPASGAQYHPLTSAHRDPRPVQSQFMTQAYRALHHNGGMVVKYPGCFLDLTRFNHPQTDNFIQLLFRDAGMQQNSVIVKVTVTLAIMLSPNLYVDQKTTGRLPVAATARQCFHPVSAASRFSVPHTDRRSVFCSPDLCL